MSKKVVFWLTKCEKIRVRQRFFSSKKFLPRRAKRQFALKSTFSKKENKNTKPQKIPKISKKLSYFLVRPFFFSIFPFFSHFFPIFSIFNGACAASFFPLGCTHISSKHNKKCPNAPPLGATLLGFFLET